MFGQFRKKPCNHEYVLADFRIHVDKMTLESEDTYVISCRKCGEGRTVDSYEYERMKGHGLIVERGWRGMTERVKERLNDEKK